ncbi:hypothetical protein Tco_1166029 [Tanacetum coccineum]
MAATIITAAPPHLHAATISSAIIIITTPSTSSSSYHHHHPTAVVTTTPSITTTATPPSMYTTRVRLFLVHHKGALVFKPPGYATKGCVWLAATTTMVRLAVTTTKGETIRGAYGLREDNKGARLVGLAGIDAFGLAKQHRFCQSFYNINLKRIELITTSKCPGVLGRGTCEGYTIIIARCSWRGQLREVHIHYCPGVLGGETYEGYIFITARVFLEGTPVMGTYGFHYCPGVLGGDTYDGYIEHRFHELRVIIIIVVLYT